MCREASVESRAQRQGPDVAVRLDEIEHFTEALRYCEDSETLARFWDGGLVQTCRNNCNSKNHSASRRYSLALKLPNDLGDARTPLLKDNGLAPTTGSEEKRPSTH